MRFAVEGDDTGWSKGHVPEPGLLSLVVAATGGLDSGKLDLHQPQKSVGVKSRLGTAARL